MNVNVSKQIVFISGFLGAFFLCLVQGSASWCQGKTKPGEDTKPLQELRENVAKALKELVAAPEKDPANLSGWESPRELLSYRYHEGCWQAIQILSKTKADVDRDLLHLARSDEQLRVRYRALVVLAMRGNAGAVAVLDKMCASKDANERYLAWLTYNWAIAEKKLMAPKNFDQHLAVYMVEKDDEIRKRMEWFFGTAQARAAAKPLIASIEVRESLPAVWALGRIGDKRAVPAIIEAYGKNGNKHYHLQALGALATPEAVDFLIKHLEEYGAVDALFRTKSPKALPALQKHLKNLEGGNDSSVYIATQLAIIRLSNEDAREQLLKMAENKDEKRNLRWNALRALQEYNAEPYQPRILKIYASDPDNDIKRVCIWLLKNSKLAAITEAMMDHALVFRVKSMSDVATEHSLLEALNNRLELSFGTMEDMRAHIRKLRKEKKNPAK